MSNIEDIEDILLDSEAVKRPRPWPGKIERDWFENADPEKNPNLRKIKDPRKKIIALILILLALFNQ